MPATVIQRNLRTGKVKTLSYPVSGNPNTATYESDVKNGFELLDWQSRIAHGLDATTEYSREIRTRISTGNFFNSAIQLGVDGKPYYEYTMLCPQVPGSEPGVSFSSWETQQIMTELRSAAVMECLARIRDESIQFAAGTFAGELRDTIRTVLNPARAIRRAIDRHFEIVKPYRVKRSTNSQKAARATKRVSDLWLQTVFGIQPLIGDVEDGARAVARVLNNLPRKSVVVALKERQIPIPVEMRKSGLSYLEWDRRINRDVTASARLQVCYQPKMVGSSQANLEAFGIDWTQVPVDAWNLLPWSFLIDYFTNVGDVLEAHATLANTDVIYHSLSEKLVENVETTSVNFRGTNLKSIYATTQPSVNRAMKFRRRKIILALEIPPIRVDGLPSMKQALNIGALIASRVFNS